MRRPYRPMNAGDGSLIRMIAGSSEKFPGSSIFSSGTSSGSAPRLGGERSQGQVNKGFRIYIDNGTFIARAFWAEPRVTTSDLSANET